jgi:hypothetical protein
MDEARTDGDDDDEGGNSEDDHGEYEDGAGSAGDGTASESKRRQARSFYFTTGSVKRIQSKEDGSLTATCQVGGHAQCSYIIPMSNGGTQGVSQHFLKYHTDLNVRIRSLKVLPGVDKNPPDFMTLLNHATPLTQEQRPIILDALNRAVEGGTSSSLSLTPTSI